MKRLARLSGQLANACMEPMGIALHRRNTKLSFQVPSNRRSVDRAVTACLIRLDPDLAFSLVPQTQVSCASVAYVYPDRAGNHERHTQSRVTSAPQRGPTTPHYSNQRNTPTRAATSNPPTRHSTFIRPVPITHSAAQHRPPTWLLAC